MYEKLPELEKKLTELVRNKSKELEKVTDNIINHIRNIYNLLRNDEFVKILTNIFSLYKIEKDVLSIIKYNKTCIPENKCNILLKNNPCIELFFRKGLFKTMYSLSYYPITNKLIIQREILELDTKISNKFKFDSEKIKTFANIRKLLKNYPLSTLLEVESTLSYFVKELEGNLFEEMIDKIIEKL
jgi:hypothetical protein